MELNYLGNETGFVNIEKYIDNENKLSYVCLWKLKLYFAQKSYSQSTRIKAVRFIVDFVSQHGEDQAKLQTFVENLKLTKSFKDMTLVKWKSFLRSYFKWLKLYNRILLKLY